MTALHARRTAWPRVVSARFISLASVAALAVTVTVALTATPACAWQDDKHPFPQHIKAPALDGGSDWLNTAGPLDLKDLRGKFVILDFWTYCCINCMHILPELKKLEHQYPNNVVVIGVHSAKFEEEKSTKNIREAILRYEIEHPVVNDANHTIWNNFGVNSWPSLRVIDPEGNLIAGNSGEIEFDTLEAFLKKAMPYYRKKGVLDETPFRFDQEKLAQKTPLRFPGKVLADEAGGRLFITDSNHNRIVVTTLDGKLLEVIGSGQIGRMDGDFAKASFDHPQGCALKGDILYVADTENHLLRKVDLAKKTVHTIAGTGKQRREGFPGGDQARRGPGGEIIYPKRWFDPAPAKTALNSPWALWIHEGDLFIAMAGPHQIWKMPLSQKEIGLHAGNGREDIIDGGLVPEQPYEQGYSSFAQPSGLSSDGTWLFVADSEGSSIRAVPFDPAKSVKTVVGTSELGGGRLFVFGDRDGDGLLAFKTPGVYRTAADVTGPLLQHPLDVLYSEGNIYVADTYNNKVKVIDLKKQSLTTVAGTGKPGLVDGEAAQFDEPAGLALAKGKLYVADTNNHAIRVIDLAAKNRVSTLAISGLEPPPPPKAETGSAFKDAKQVILKAATVKAADGKIELAVELKLPEGFKVNPLAPMRYLVEPTGAEGPVDREALGKVSTLEKPATSFKISLPVKGDGGDDKLKVSLIYYYCREGNLGVCKVGTVTWTAPIKVAADGGANVPLSLDVK